MVETKRSEIERQKPGARRRASTPKKLSKIAILREALDELKDAHSKKFYGNLEIIDLFGLKAVAIIDADERAESEDEQRLRAMIDRALIDLAFERIMRARFHMLSNQLEIDSLRNETRATLAQILT